MLSSVRAGCSAHDLQEGLVAGEGAEIEMPIDDQRWGDYFGSLEDRFGVHWMVNHSPPRDGEL